MSQKKSEHVADNSKKQEKEDSLIPNGELKWRKDEESLQDTDLNLKQIDKEKETQTAKETKAEDQQDPAENQQSPTDTNHKEDKKQETDQKFDKQETETNQKVNKKKDEPVEEKPEKQKAVDKTKKETEKETASKDDGQKKSSTAQKESKTPIDEETKKQSAEQTKEKSQKKKDKLTSDREAAAAAETAKQRSLEDTDGPLDFKEYSVEVKSDEKQKKEKDPAESAFVFKQDDKKQSKRKPVTREKVKKSRDKLPKWKFFLRILWLPVSLVVAMLLGLIIGNTVIGEQPVGESFNIDNWVHLYKLIFTK